MNYEEYEEYEENLLLFSRLFEEGFNRPNIKTKKFTELWYDVDLLMGREALSGPFYHVDMYYNCDYVFEGEHEYFKEIRSCEDLLNWCLSSKWAASYPLVSPGDVKELLTICFTIVAKILLSMTNAGDLPIVPPELFAKFLIMFYSSAKDAVFKALGV